MKTTLALLLALSIHAQAMDYIFGHKATPSPSPTSTATVTPVPTRTPTATPSATVTLTPIPTPTPKITPTVTVTPIGTPTPSVTVSPSASPSATPSATPNVMRPHGIVDLGPKGYTNDAADGVRVRLGWTDAQPKSATEYDWSKVDSAIAQAKANHKQLGISFAMLSDPPDWLKAIAKTWPLPATSSGNARAIVLPWDTAVQPKILAFIAAFGARYDGKIDYVAMGGLGAVIESYITPDPATLGLTSTDACAKWVSSSNAIIDAHAAAFHITPFIFTAAKPFDNSDGIAALQNVVDAAAGKYGARFGVMDCSLNAHSDLGYVPHALVQKYSSSHPVGLQFLCSSVGFGGHDLGGTVAQTLDAGVALGAHFIEVYPADAEDSTNASKLRETASKLAP